MRAYIGVSGAIFGTIALLHVLRLAFGWPAQIGSWIVPAWVSWVALLISGILFTWALWLFSNADQATRAPER